MEHKKYIAQIYSLGVKVTVLKHGKDQEDTYLTLLNAIEKENSSLIDTKLKNYFADVISEAQEHDFFKGAVLARFIQLSDKFRCSISWYERNMINNYLPLSERRRILALFAAQPGLNDDQVKAVAKIEEKFYFEGKKNDRRAISEKALSVDLSTSILRSLFGHRFS